MSMTVEGIRKRYFMSLAPVYLITSSLLMQAHLKNTNEIALGFSVLFLLIPVWLVVASFLKLRDVVVNTTYQICSSLALVSALVFVIGWLGTLTDLLNLKASPTYIYAFFGLGLLLYFAILAFNVYNAFKRS